MVATQPGISPGIHENLSNAAYHAAPGLSCSGLKTFRVSPLHYWHEKLNPALECSICQAPRGDHPTPACAYFSARAETAALRLGSALHAATLEPDSFLDRYAPRKTAADFPDALDSVKDIKEWLDAKGLPYKKSALKPELESTAAAAGAPILGELLKQQAAIDHGKQYLDKSEWARVYGMASALRREAELKPYLADGVGEVSIFAVDPDTGALLKCRLDWMSALRCIVDLKSYSCRGENIDRTVSKAIEYEYRWQPWFYLHVMRLAGLDGFSWLYAFVESDAPYEVRLRSMGMSGARGPNKYWEATGNEIRAAIAKYAEYEQEFGDTPWAYHQAIDPVRDSELSRVVWRDEE